MQFHSFLPSELDGGGGKLKTLVALSTGKESLVFTKYEAGRIPEMVWTLWRGEKPLAPAMN
jgi:hypothetical protein